MTVKESGQIKRGVGLYWFAAVFVVAALLAILYFDLFGSSRASSKPPLEQIVFATNTEYIGTCAITAAREKGFFADEGIQAQVLSFSSGKAAMEAVLDGRANMGTVADIPIMFAGLNQQPVSVIATIFRTEKDHGIVGRRDKGIVDPKDLKGKRIGVTLSTSGHFTLSAFLNRQKLSAKDVTIVNYKPEEFADALERGDIDAAASWEPFLDGMLTRLGSNGVAFYGQDVYESLYNVVTMRSYIGKHSEVIKRVIKAIDQGSRFCNDKQDAARDMLNTVKKADSKSQKTAWASYHFEVELDQGLLLALEDQARWAIKNKLTTKKEVPNYLDYVYLDGMSAVKPSAVTIIH